MVTLVVIDVLLFEDFAEDVEDSKDEDAGVDEEEEGEEDPVPEEGLFPGPVNEGLELEGDEESGDCEEEPEGYLNEVDDDLNHLLVGRDDVDIQPEQEVEEQREDKVGVILLEQFEDQDSENLEDQEVELFGHVAHHHHFDPIHKRSNDYFLSLRW